MTRRRVTHDETWQFQCLHCGFHFASTNLPWVHQQATRHLCTPLVLSPVPPDVHVGSGASAPLTTYAALPDTEMSWHGIRTPLEVW